MSLGICFGVAGSCHLPEVALRSQPSPLLSTLPCRSSAECAKKRTSFPFMLWLSQPESIPGFVIPGSPPFSAFAQTEPAQVQMCPSLRLQIRLSKDKAMSGVLGEMGTN